MSYTQVPPNSTGNKIDTVTVVDAGGNTVHRQVVNPADCLILSGTVNTSFSHSLSYGVVLAGGSEYVVGDIITLAGGTFLEAAAIEVVSVNGSGAVTAFKISKIGKYSVTAATLTQGTTTGSGTGFSLTATFSQYVLAMVDTTGFNQLQFQYTTWSGSGNTRVEGSIDGGKSWVNIPFFFNDTPALGTTGSVVSWTYNFVPQPWPLTRIIGSNNANGVHVALRSISQQAATVRQGANTGTNNIWYTKSLATNFGAAGASGGGGVVAKIISSAGTNGLIVTSSGYKTLHSIVLGNSGAAMAYLKIYNKSTTPVVGTDVPVAVYPISAGGVLSMNMDTAGYHLNCTNGWSIGITGGAADTDTTAVTAGQVSGTIILN